jgi:hypothetical protein
MAVNIGHRAVLALCAMALALAVSSVGDAERGEAPVVRFHVPRDHPERWFVELTGARADADVSVAVDGAGLPPLIGRVESIGAARRFISRYAPEPGVVYIARAAGAVESRFALPASAASAASTAAGANTERTRVVAIYPTLDRVPANLLKLYVEFSAPMRDGEAEQRLRLLDARGREMPRAFLHVDAELWNESHTRLTVLFDPGRIKRGLRANLEDGAPLTEGQTFRLAIDPAWRDGRGASLASAYERTLTVGAADRKSPDWRRWIVDAPRAGTRDAVTVRFDEPLDRALLDRWLMVIDASAATSDAAAAPAALAGNAAAAAAAAARVPGRASVGPDQRSWSFVPDQPWHGDRARNGAGARYRVLVDPRLEDVAGNSLSALFDATASAQPRRDRTALIALPFTPRH